MGILYDFERLIKKYAIELQVVILKEGHYEAGDWIEGEIEQCEQKLGAVIPLSDQKVISNGGIYKKEDKRLLILEEAPLNSYILIDNKKYQVLEDTDFSNYAGFYSYILKRVDNFDRPAKLK